MRYFLTLALSLAACFVVQTIALRAVGGKTTKSESNFFSSIARIQTGAKNSPEIMILGSSITGRLPDRAQGFDGVANLGCDGGSALDTLRAIDRGEFPIPHELWIEGNTLSLGLSVQETEISQAISSPMFKVGMQIPQLSATARPAAFAYSFLFQWKIGSAEGPHGPRLPTTSKPEIITTPSQDLTYKEQVLVNEISEIIERLKAKGTKAYLLLLPKAPAKDSINHRLAESISAKAGIPFWNLEEGLSQKDYVLTDGVHMAPHSAAATVRTILTAHQQGK